MDLRIAIPLAWFARFNMTPGRHQLYPLSRHFIMGRYAVHERIWSIVLVAIVGFGAARHAGNDALLHRKDREFERRFSDRIRAGRRARRSRRGRWSRQRLGERRGTCPQRPVGVVVYSSTWLIGPLRPVPQSRRHSRPPRPGAPGRLNAKLER